MQNANSKFQPQVLGITAFMESNRIDFCLQGPNVEKQTVSAFYDNPKAELVLDGKALVVGVPNSKSRAKNPKKVVFETDENGEPMKLNIQYDGQNIRLGRRTKAKGKVSFYRSLESQNNGNAPKSSADIIAALGNFS
jgi:hypothetical protein